MSAPQLLTDRTTMLLRTPSSRNESRKNLLCDILNEVSLKQEKNVPEMLIGRQKRVVLQNGIRQLVTDADVNHQNLSGNRMFDGLFGTMS